MPEKKIHPQDAALAVDCLVCFASPGQPCCSEDCRRTVPVHSSRIIDLQDYVREGKSAYEQALAVQRAERAV